MFGSAALPALAFIVCLRFVPESPRWLIQQNRLPEADAAFCAIGGEGRRSEQLEEIRAAIAEEAPARGWLRRLRRPLLLAVVIAGLQQLTGINTVLYYGTLLFVTHGNSGSDQRAFAANVLIGLTNLIFTMVAFSIMDRLGRRTLLTGSAAVMFSALLLLAFAFQHAHASFALSSAAPCFLWLPSPPALAPERGSIWPRSSPPTFADEPCPSPPRRCG
jgi:hypothetical protein